MNKKIEKQKPNSQKCTINGYDCYISNDNTKVKIHLKTDNPYLMLDEILINQTITPKEEIQ